MGLALAGLIVWAASGTRSPATTTKKTPPTPVSVARAESSDVALTLSEIGSALPWQGVTIHTQVNGLLKKVDFAEGSFVQAGSLLAEIDPAPYQAVLTQAQGALARDRALLQEAKVDLKRYQTLAAQDSIASQQVDTQLALVHQYEGTVKADEGTVAAAQVNVNYCRITSPIAGRVGVRLVDPGNVVSTTDTNGIVIVNQITPIAVTFTVPEGEFQRLTQVSQGFTRPLPVRALSQETGEELGVGSVSIADNHVDQTTGTVTLKARFENQSKRLWPSQFVNVKVNLQTLPHATVIPAAAVNQGPKGAYAYVVGPDHKVVVRPLRVVAIQEETAIIASGVQPGDTVVVDGQLVLKPGAEVAAHPVAPAKRASV